MTKRRRTFTEEFKAKVALEALRGRDTIRSIAHRHGLHPNQVSRWKRRMIDALPEVFASGAHKGDGEQEAEIRKLQAKHDELVAERDFLRRALEG